MSDLVEHGPFQYYIEQICLGVELHHLMKILKPLTLSVIADNEVQAECEQFGSQGIRFQNKNSSKYLIVPSLQTALYNRDIRLLRIFDRSFNQYCVI